MIVTTWSLVQFLHITGAIVWVGGQLTLAGFVGPVARRHLDDAERLALMRDIGRRYAVTAVAIALPLQLVTGLALTFHYGVTGHRFQDTDWSRTFTVKLVLVVLAVVLAGVHGALSARDRNREARVASLSGLTTSIVVVLLGTGLAFG